MRKLSVLIVDDNEADRYILRRHLQRTNLDIQLFEAIHGGIALELLQQHPAEPVPDVIFMDINMPVMDGWEFLEQFPTLQPQSAFASCVIVMLSSSAHNDDHERANTYSRVSHFMIKGQYTPGSLQQLVEHLIAA